MSVLNDKDLKKLILEQNAIYVKNPDPQIDFELQLGPSSIDLRLGKEFVVFDTHNIRVIDTKKLEGHIGRTISVTEKEGFVLHPNQFALGTTIEYVKIPNDMLAILEGRSSYGRLGLMIHSTAGHVNPGWEGKLTLELQNIGRHPIILYPKERICQLVFHKLTGEAEKPYSKKADAKYQHQEGAAHSKLFSEKRKTN